MLRFGLRRSTLGFEFGWGQSSCLLRGARARWLSQWVESWRWTNSQHRKIVSLSPRVENLNLKKVIKVSYLNQESRQCFVFFGFLCVWIFYEHYKNFMNVLCVWIFLDLYYTILQSLSWNCTVKESTVLCNPHQPVKTKLDELYSINDVRKAKELLKIGKAAQVDSFPPEIWWISLPATLSHKKLFRPSNPASVTVPVCFALALSVTSMFAFRVDYILFDLRSQS